MDKKRINEFFERVAKMDPKPVITVIERRFSEKDKKYHRHSCTGVFGWWNGQEGSFEMRKAETRKLKSGHFWWFKPFHIEYIVSVRITTEQEMIDDRNFLFELLERIDEKKRTKKIL